MSCAIWEEPVALFAGGDLEPAEAAGVERHLSECAACRALAADLQSNLDGLREAHREPLAREHYTAVRAGVLAELAKAPRPRMVSAWGWAGALAAAAAGVWLVWVAWRPAARVPADAPRGAAHVPAQSGADALARARHPRRAPESDRVSDRSRVGGAAVGLGRPARLALPHNETVFDLTVLPGPGSHALAMAESASLAPAESSSVHMVQLATDDPNVVIYLLLDDGTGDE